MVAGGVIELQVERSSRAEAMCRASLGAGVVRHRGPLSNFVFGFNEVE